MAEVRDHIENDPQLREDWGLDGPQVVAEEEQKLCATHRSPVRPRVADEQQTQTQSRENAYSEEKDSNVGTDTAVKAETGAAFTDSTTVGAEQGNSTTSGRTGYDCSSGDPTCPLNRRAALNEMEFHSATNNHSEDSLRDRWERHGEQTSETETEDNHDHNHDHNHAPADNEDREDQTEKTPNEGEDDALRADDVENQNEGAQASEDTNEGISPDDTQSIQSGEGNSEDENEGISTADTPNGNDSGNAGDGENEGEEKDKNLNQSNMRLF